MGTVFSIVQFPFRLVENVLSVGAAAVAGAFYPFNIHYFSGLSTVLPHCEPAETEPFEDFSVVLGDFCDAPNCEGLNVKTQLPQRRQSFHTKAQAELSPIWRSRTVQAKKLYKAAAVEAQRKAIRFRRRYSLYGPPDWVDPAVSLLPPSCLYPPIFVPNILPSVFPFAAPHIVLSPLEPVDPLIPLANALQQQDQAGGNRLIVADPPSCAGPQPVIVNPVRRPLSRERDENPDEQFGHELPSDDNFSDVQPPTDGHDDASSCGSTGRDASPSLPSPIVQGVFLPHVAPQGKAPDFWIEEDEDALPDLPQGWLL